MIFLSKKSIITVTVCAILLVASGSIAAIAGTMFDEPCQGVIVLDAGHGLPDGGVVGASGARESEINLTFVKCLSGILEQRGYEVILTRKDAFALDPVKRKDMTARKKIIDAAHADLMISMHVNKFSDPSRRGAQVFFDDTKRGENLAILLQSALNTHVNAKFGNRSDLKALAGDFYITKCSALPSVIVECGFISNAEDERLLLSEQYRSALCRTVADAVESIRQTMKRKGEIGV